MTLGTATTVALRRTREAKAIDPLRFVAAAAAHLHGWAVSEEGRRRTARVLRSLDRGTWQVRRNIRLPDGGRADHLAIGPSGVYLLDSRAWHGVVTVDHKGATITPPGQPAAAWIARGQHCSLAPAAAALRRAASTTDGPRLDPHAVVVIWAPFPEGLAVSGAITYVSGDRLAAWMSEQPCRQAITAARGERAEPVLAHSSS
jgi:Nuclease-related domain